MTTLIHWKWGNNTKNIKSERKNETQSKSSEATEKENIDVFEKKLKPFYDEPSDKREITSERISERELIRQTPINPFLSKDNYIGDLNIQDTLLRPMDSNMDSNM